MSGASRSLLGSIAWRFLRGHRTRLLSGTARTALVATAVGVTAMVIAMALMTGYREDLQEKLIRGNAAVIVYPLQTSEVAVDETRLDELQQLEGVLAVRRVVYGQGSLSGAGEGGGIEATFRGLDPGDGLGDLDAVELWGELEPPSSDDRGDLPWAVVGRELFERLGLAPNEPARITVLGLESGRARFRFRSVRVTGTFTTGFSEFDQSWVMVDRRALEKLLGQGAGLSVWEVAAEKPSQAPRLAEEARRLLGDSFLVTDWRSLNRELFTALEVQQIALFFVLGLIVLVSTFNVASSLVVLVRERMRDVGLLAALGLAPRQLRWLFLLYGSGLGLAGSLCGVGLGSLVSWIFTRYELIRFGPEMAAIYFISSVPFRVRPVDVAAVVSFTLAVTLLACWLPARRAARVRPAVALRYE